MIVLLLILLAFCVFLPQLTSFSDSLNTLRNADVVYIGLATTLWLTTFFSAALIYKYIALRPIDFSRILLVQFASGFTNRLLPLGAGIVTLNVRFLMKNGHSASQAGAVVALNNILGFMGTVILFLSAVTLGAESVSSSFDHSVYIPVYWKIVIVVFVLVSLYLLQMFGKKLISTVKTASKTVLQRTLQKPKATVLALLASLLITLGYVAALYAVGLAFNAHLTFFQALIVMTIGVAVASFTPTPGGVGGAEAGLIAALISAGVTPHQALITALMYRFITFWLPIIPGFIAFQLALRRHYI